MVVALEPVRPVVEDIVGSRGDPTVLEYVISVLEDGDFEFGPDGQEAYEAFGEMLVSLSRCESSCSPTGRLQLAVLTLRHTDML